MKQQKIIISWFIAASMLLFLVSCRKGYEFPFRDPSLPVDERVDDLISRLSLEEKAGQMVNSADTIARLGIDPYNWWNECLHGVARSGQATVFPQSIGMAATWDTSLIYELATAISDEARAKNNYYRKNGQFSIYQGLTYWSPNINIFRDPRWGRGMETYGEDPYLTGKIGVAFVRGLQGNDPKYLKLVATSKHYVVHSGPEPDRHTFDAVASRRDLLETYLPAFEMTVHEANVQSVMCAYNRTNSEVCCGSDLLLNRLLRDTIGFSGYIVSDCNAVSDFYRGHKVVNTMPEAAAMAVKAGTDLNCGGSYRSLPEAVKLGLITEPEIDVSLKRLLKARFQLGMFDPEEMVPFSKIPLDIVECEKHVRIAEDAARESMVLLKNDKNVLPLDKKIKTLAVIGPNANDIEVMYGNYNGFSKNPVTPLEGIRRKLPGTRILYARGCDIAEGMPALEVIPSEMLFTSPEKDENGLKAEYYSFRTLEGNLFLTRVNPELTRVDRKIEFNWWDGTPVPELKDDHFSVRWNGYILAPESGEYCIGGEGVHQFNIEFGGEEIIKFSSTHDPVKVYKKIRLEKGRRYPVKIDYVDTRGMASFNLLWQRPRKDLKKEAIEAARNADAVVMFMGLSPRLEGEEMRVDVEGFKGGDRITLGLPKIQSDLIKTIHSLGKPVVLVLLNGSAVSVNWESENIPAILEAWYPGQSAGTAIADVLFGDANPSGRLPVTYYKSEKDLPDFNDYNMEGKTYRYFRKEPLYPFGFGLSYTTFAYGNLKTPPTAGTGENMVVSVDVTNTGKMDGKEVVQLYISNNTSSVPVPIRSLRGFKKIFLKAGETKTVEFRLSPMDFSIINESGERVTEPGSFTISVGGCQPGEPEIAAKKVMTAGLEIR